MKTAPFFTAFLLASFSISAQITGSEQDCIGAIPICGQIITQANAYEGTGMTEDILDLTSCLENEENNSVWYTFDIAQSGMLEFIIAAIEGPDDSTDYDFALFNLTGKSCAGIKNENLEIRCNYAFTDTITGLRTGDTATTASTTGPHFLAPLPVTTGQKFALLIDNFSSENNGFILDFSNSTAMFGYKPAIEQVIASSCSSSDLLRVEFTISVPCDLISPDGSNFTVGGASSVTIDGIRSSDCATANRTDYVLLEYSGSFIDDSSYILRYHSDSVPSDCSILDELTGFQPRDTSLFLVTANFSYNAGFNQVILLTDNSQGDILAYDWSFGDGNYSSAPSPVHTYATGGAYNVCLAVTGFCESDTFCQSVFIDTATLVSELNQSIYVEVFPNPTTGILTINADMPSNASVNIHVFDVFGKQVYHEEKQNILRQLDLNLENQSRGVYFLRLSNHEFSLTRRFTILR